MFTYPGDRYTLNSDGTAEVYTLGITDLSLVDAGRYRCQGQYSATVDAHAHVIVLGERV